MNGNSADGGWVGPVPPPIYSIPGGSIGADFSANAPALPNVGEPFGGTGPYANFVLLAQVPASLYRSAVTVVNQAGANLALVRDDGLAAFNQPPLNASVFPLASGATFQTTSFKGRLSIYGASGGDVVTVMVD